MPIMGTESAVSLVHPHFHDDLDVLVLDDPGRVEVVQVFG